MGDSTDRTQGRRPLLALLMAMAITAGACTGGDPDVDRSTPSSSERGRAGGTLRVIIPEHDVSYLSGGSALDPQVDWWNDSFELFRCCLLRTLLAHPGLPPEEGGTELHPDLAARMPEISPDGRTWTFQLKEEITYGPPLQDTPVVAGDFIRALERTALLDSTGNYAFYYSVIEGFDAVLDGEADSIAGLEAPDDSTLIVHLTQPAGDLANLFAMPATAPIPPSPLDPSSRLGVAEGLRRYGRNLVATGPYMIEGSEDLDLSVTPELRDPISGYVPRYSLTLVRNPSWRRETDPLRPAYVDRIEVTIGPRIGEAVRMIAAGEADVFLFENPAPQVRIETVERFRSHPELGVSVHIEDRDLVRYVSMNLAVPPLDDLHVRKAISHAIDKQTLLDLRGGEIVGEVAGHIVLDSMEDQLLDSYDPYPTSLTRAREEMSRSSYDADRDGRCDAEVCRGLVMQAATNYFPQMDEVVAQVAEDLERIGIDLTIEWLARDGTEFDGISDPTKKVPMALFPAWGKDFLNASTFVSPLFSSRSIGGANYSLVGATPVQLRQWGYQVTSVPSIDEKIDGCLELAGDVQVRCWAEADQLLMERVVPWVPYVFEHKVQLVSDRVVEYSFDQFTTSPALDRLVVSPAEG